MAVSLHTVSKLLHRRHGPERLTPEQKQNRPSPVAAVPRNVTRVMRKASVGRVEAAEKSSVQHAASEEPKLDPARPSRLRESASVENRMVRQVW